MATSKLLKPTNVTISIPEFTDQPDQRVNSNCIDKEADAINALSEQLNISTNNTATDCNTVSGNKAYSIASSSLNRPFDWGVLFDVSPNEDGLGFRFQIAISFDGTCAIRGRNNIGAGATWSQWKTVQVS